MGVLLCRQQIQLVQPRRGTRGHKVLHIIAFVGEELCAFLTGNLLFLLLQGLWVTWNTSRSFIQTPSANVKNTTLTGMFYYIKYKCEMEKEGFLF